MICDHVWNRTGMFLMKLANVYVASGVSGRQAVGGPEGYWGHQTPEVEMCAKCGLLRIPPAAGSEASNEQTKLCACGKRMILCYTGITFTSCPPQHERMWWCGGCDARERAPSEVEQSQQQSEMSRWRFANPEPQS